MKILIIGGSKFVIFILGMFSVFRVNFDSWLNRLADWQVVAMDLILAFIQADIERKKGLCISS